MSSVSSDQPVLAALQEKFEFIMVDECQDIDPAQWDVIQQIISISILLSNLNFFLLAMRNNHLWF